MTREIAAIWDAELGRRVPHCSWSVRLDGELLAAHAPGRAFSSASTIKTFVLAAALAHAEEGAIGLAAPLAVAPEHAAPGDGVLAHLALPLALPWRDVLWLMTAVSDNTATNAVLDALSIAAVNERLASWGLDARVRGWIGGGGPRDPAARAAGADPSLPTAAGIGVASPADHEALLEAIAAGRLLPRLGTTALDLLAGQQQRWGLARYVGEHLRFAHKLGAADAVRHDGGMLFAADGRRLHVTCFTDGGPLAEWPDHPALVGMGAAFAATARLLGIGLEGPEPE